MPYLKKKISNARKKIPLEDPSEDEDSKDSDIPPPYQKPDHSEKPSKMQITVSPQINNYESKRETSKPNSKNIVKNYGKAMCSFASSELALPYLKRINSNNEINLETFQDHIHKKRDLIDSIDSLRCLLLITKSDDEISIGFKRVFQEISIIFIKYFSVNWIFQGKMSHKQAHLRARFKMLRRIKNPQHFTYFKDFSR
jgi:hypothetical protein